MKLSSLELAGFKSFADPTELKFDDGITGIVGPNGCGKSNVVDAIKWVLGEMSAKSLRGEGMLDVIFNGSSGRKPMGMAEVSLNFTNDDRRLPVDANHVKITRRLYRDSTSEYLVNNQPSRLRDIREMFMDTGIGVDAYSMIGQGQVSAFLDANSYDRREIFEEAAGISRFKARKKEALRKLEKTDQNLAQTQLVLDEVEKQLRSVKQQAGRARSYQEYSARLTELRKAHSLHEYHQLHLKLTELTTQRGELADSLAEVRRKLDQARQLQQDLQLEMDGVQESARQAERQAMTLESQRQSTLQQEQFARRQAEQTGQQIELLERRRGELAQRFAELEAQAARHVESLAQLDEQLLRQEQLVLEAVKRQEAAAVAIAGINRSLDEAKSQAVDFMRQSARINSETSGLVTAEENARRQAQRLQSQRQELDGQLGQAEAKAQSLESHRAELAAAVAGLTAEMTTVVARQQSNSQKHSELSAQLAEKREARSGLKSRQSLLQDLEARREGVADGVRQVLKARESGERFAAVRGIVGDLINTQLEHAGVIEAALGDLQQTLVVESAAAMAAEAEAWRMVAGRVSVLAADRLARAGSESPGIPANCVRAVDLVQFEESSRPVVEYVLGETYVVENLEQALELAGAAGPRRRFVTRSGEVVGSDGLFVAGDMSRKTGAVRRRSELARLAMELHEVEAEIETLSGQAQLCDQQSQELNRQQQQLRDRIYQSQSDMARVQAELAQNQQQVQKLHSQLPLLEAEMQNLLSQAEQAAARRSELAARVAELEASAQQAEQRATELVGSLQQSQSQAKELGEEATKLRIALGQLQEQRNAVSRELLAQQQSLRNVQSDSAAAESDITLARDKQSESLRHAEASALKAVELAESSAEAQQAAAAQAQRLADIKRQSTEAAALLAQQERQAAELAEQDHQYSLAENEVSVRLETLVERTGEELQVNLVEAHAGYEPVEQDWTAIAAEIADLKGKIARLGSVNLEAINELAQLEDRQKFLAAQIGDIVDAKRQLEDLINKINDDSRQRFTETFETIRREFGEMFRRLFGGGRADIILETPEDVLESGIDILARPPGKELQSISLLSGGEKTMAAVALVMAIFKSKPSPFCVLDEVDAALDEANTGRFAAIVQDFLQYSQFIIITHNKRMMAAANLLYGITMQEQGVSKRVAVRFDGKVSERRPAGSAPAAGAGDTVAGSGADAGGAEQSRSAPAELAGAGA